ncbi:hypothetical protein LJC36_00100 [Desulfovibrio sp. OttesenSCG-928-C14]|nr:hypothetical protein [Desulfovibrio sp. OttesenSCG-928-C14]
MEKIFKQIPDWPGYAIAADGTVRGPLGFVLQVSGGKFGTYHKGKKGRLAVADLLAALWPPQELVAELLQAPALPAAPPPAPEAAKEPAIATATPPPAKNSPPGGGSRE